MGLYNKAMKVDGYIMYYNSVTQFKDNKLTKEIQRKFRAAHQMAKESKNKNNPQIQQMQNRIAQEDVDMEEKIKPLQEWDKARIAYKIPELWVKNKLEYSEAQRLLELWKYSR